MVSLDLNMGYYHIELYPGAKHIYNFVLPWGKYEYQKLHAGVCNGPNIPQENIFKLFEGFDMICACKDSIIVIQQTTM